MCLAQLKRSLVDSCHAQLPSVYFLDVIWLLILLINWIFGSSKAVHLLMQIELWNTGLVDVADMHAFMCPQANDY